MIKTSNIYSYFCSVPISAGYYQNEKEMTPDATDTDRLCPVQLPSRASRKDDTHPYRNQPSPPVVNSGFSVQNPDYFDDDSEIWKPKHRNGYHPVPNNNNVSPVHKSISEDSDHPYYRSMNGGIHGHGNGGLHLSNGGVPSSGSSSRVNRLHSTESQM